VEFSFYGEGYRSAFKMKVKIRVRTLVKVAHAYMFIAKITSVTIKKFHIIYIGFFSGE
jgi:hypothetical protein